MSDHEINVAIAEVVGWTLVKDDPDFYEYWEHPKDGRKIGVAANPSPFPDYCNDLNAMQSAVLSQSEEFQSEFDKACRNTGKLFMSISAKEFASIFLQKK